MLAVADSMLIIFIGTMWYIGLVYLITDTTNAYRMQLYDIDTYRDTGLQYPLNHVSSQAC